MVVARNERERERGNREWRERGKGGERVIIELDSSQKLKGLEANFS